MHRILTKFIFLIILYKAPYDLKFPIIIDFKIFKYLITPNYLINIAAFFPLIN